jgi:hypothetical protein
MSGNEKTAEGVEATGLSPNPAVKREERSVRDTDPQLYEMFVNELCRQLDLSTASYKTIEDVVAWVRNPSRPLPLPGELWLEELLDLILGGAPGKPAQMEARVELAKKQFAAMRDRVAAGVDSHLVRTEIPGAFKDDRTEADRARDVSLASRGDTQARLRNFFDDLLSRTNLDAPSAWDILRTCFELAVFLIDKNTKYGDSALDPVRIMSSVDPREQIRVRMDDKLSRLMRGHAGGEDALLDLVGYWVLLKIAERRYS